jgi:transcriptional regulator with XRE-family HTH domain
MAQELAALFHRSGWTQEQLAKKEGVKQPRVSQLLLFDRFLNFITKVIIPETSLMS